MRATWRDVLAYMPTSVLRQINDGQHEMSGVDM